MRRESWRALFHQRRLWWAGAFRHWWINVDRNLLHLPPVLTSYYLIAIWASWYFTWWTTLSSPWMIVFPFYALAQVLVLPPFGALKYFELARRRRCVGRYQFGYRRREVLRVIARVMTYPTGRQ